MREVGVQRFSARHAEHDRAEYEQAAQSVAENEFPTVNRVERSQYVRVLNDPGDPERTDREKPNQDDRTKKRADSPRPAALHREQADENDDRERHDERLRGFGPHSQSF